MRGDAALATLRAETRQLPTEKEFPAAWLVEFTSIRDRVWEVCRARCRSKKYRFALMSYGRRTSAKVRGAGDGAAVVRHRRHGADGGRSARVRPRARRPDCIPAGTAGVWTRVIR